MTEVGGYSRTVVESRRPPFCGRSPAVLGTVGVCLEMWALRLLHCSSQSPADFLAAGELKKVLS